ncbi:Heat stress transcription factor [Seminavis robusta]|uniref:Heat stress transcription factor n=1 Tax=Seminavis robusta TaxID=568900 RepID=A0A9N8E917_9STRA|nr:Heat stress transcription factor [Seminavis robusta]|eukprot:Sro807_g205210.1 Heat stress transcription factor (318) ;mRNA; r:12297-13343
MSSEQKPTGDSPVGGLCHLVEAATALSKLVEASGKRSEKAEQPVQPAEQTAALAAERTASISDDDEDKKNGVRCNKREIFPQRLLAILNDSSLSDTCTWLPGGRSFVIVRPDVFTEKVLPKYLPPVDARGSTKYPSFTRKLNRWGFRQITRGPDTGAFHHPLFRRDEPHLCLQMVCQRSRDRRSSGSAKQAMGAAPTLQAPQKPAPATEPQTLALPARTASVVSSDDSSSTSESTRSMASSSSASTHVTLMKVATPTVAAVATNAILKPAVMPQQAPFVSKDETLVQDALRQSVENERIRAAKAMLYHSYMQALGGR